MAASPLSNRINAGLPRCVTSTCAATKTGAKKELSRKLQSSALFGQQGRKRRPDLVVVSASAAPPPQHSPQNTENPLVGPSPTLSANEAVEVQLRALENDDSPWQGHGVQTAYLFCRDSGSMEMSRYFCGKSASLYHEDHFVGKFRTSFPELLRPGARVTGVLDGGDESGAQPVRVEVEAAGGGSGSSNTDGSPSTFIFSLERCEMGRRKGSWLVAAVHRKEEED